MTKNSTKSQFLYRLLMLSMILIIVLSSGIYSQSKVLISKGAAIKLSRGASILVDEIAGDIKQIEPLLTDQIDSTKVAVISSFTAIAERNNVILNWEAGREVDISGYSIERKISTENNWIMVGTIYEFESDAKVKIYRFEDKGLKAGMYGYRLKQFGNYEDFTSSELSVNITVGLPETFSLSQNYPNPFNPVTEIVAALPKDSYVKLVIYDIQGKQTVVLVNQELKAGYHNIKWDASKFSSGIYFYKLIAGNFTETKKMILTK